MVEECGESGPLGPVRGLILERNAKRQSLAAIDLERWVLLNRVVYKAEKVDVAWSRPSLDAFEALKRWAEQLDVKLSLRVDCATPPPDAAALRHAAPWDLFLCPSDPEAPDFEAWLRAGHDSAIPMRVQLCEPFPSDPGVSELVERVAAAGVVAVNIAAHDPFSNVPPARDSEHTQTAVARMNALADAFKFRGVEVNLLGLPFCNVEADNRRFVLNERQYFLDHQQYMRDSFELACRLFRKHPYRTRIILLILLEQTTSTRSPIDRILLPWIMDHPWVRARVWALHKITRHRGKRPHPIDADPSGKELQRQAEESREARREAMGPVCAACRLWRICDGLSPALKKRYPGIQRSAEEGEEVIAPFHFRARRPRYFDAIDAARRVAPPGDPDLVERANAIARERPPDREIGAFDYRVEGTWSWPLPGCLRWFSFTNTEKISTPLARLDPPFALSATFGGGIAEYVGFALGRGCRLVCPMVGYTHRVMLHVEADGRYVLLRDGYPVVPVQFAGSYYAPVRLGKALEPRISIWNIDGTIGTQAVYLWDGGHGREFAASDCRFSIVVVSTRYARRLQACLESVAHQTGVRHGEIQVIVAFVPGLDATEDVIDSLQLTHPGLRIEPSAFAAEHGRNKGLLLNECLGKARGEWVLILDADIILAPDMLSRMAELPDDCMFAIPDGRKMLSRETTARVLLGEVHPWEQWEQLLKTAGEYRFREADGVPVGYCQCVRRHCLDQVQYEEMHHFEGADWKFGKDMRETFGMETRLSGVPVLHLDHGGSNWYGTARHY